MEISRAPELTANLSSDGDHRTDVAARLIRSRTKVGFQPEGDGSHTYAFLSMIISVNAVLWNALLTSSLPNIT